MDYTIFLCLTLALVSVGHCASIPEKSPRSYTKELMGCGLVRDASCFLQVAGEFVEEQRTAILAQADQEVVKATGRSDDESSPSQLSKAINRIIEELTDMFKDGISGLFKNARDGEENDELDDEENQETAKKSMPKGTAGEARKKKKKKKLIGLIKLLIIGAVLKAKITLLLKAFSAALQIKFFLVALAGLILNAIRFYLDLKKGHQPQKVIYYEHAQHQHHYEGGDEEYTSGPGGGYWGRSYDLEGEKNAQDLAYAKQKPTKVGDSSNNNSGYSWLG